MVARLAGKSIARLRNSRWLSTIYHELRLRQAGSLRADPILVFQMGKVASSSIFATVKKANLGLPVFHIHFLNPQSIRLADETLRRTFGSHVSVNRWALYESRYVRKHFLRKRNGTLKIISLVRDPVSRNLSSFFANLDMYIPDCAARFERRAIDVEEIRERYLNDFHEHSYPLEWFDREVQSTFGIDVFSQDDLLARERTAFLYRRDHVDLLVLRVEDLDTVAVPALQKFLGLRSVTLEKANEARHKDYDDVYRMVKDRFWLPGDYLERMYTSKLATRFYTESEIHAFRSKWSPR
jgi:hypothetical protein